MKLPSLLIVLMLALPLTTAAAQAPPTPVPTATPVFNFDEVLEVVSEMPDDHGTTHYVTLDEDTEGTVRIRLSLFSFPEGPYNAVVFRSGDCSATGTFGPDDALASFPFELKERAGLVLVFFNTRVIRVAHGVPGTIYDGDGASLAIYRPADSGAGPVACARLDRPVAAPATGNSEAGGPSPSPAAPLLAGLLAVAIGLAAVAVFRSRRGRQSDG